MRDLRTNSGAERDRAFALLVALHSRLLKLIHVRFTGSAAPIHAEENGFEVHCSSREHQRRFHWDIRIH